MKQQALEQMQREAEMEAGRQAADRDLQFHGEPLDLREDLRDAYATMPEEERQKLRNLMKKYENNIERSPELYGNFIHSVFTRAIMEHQMRMEDAGTGVEETDPDLGLLFRDIGEFKDTEIPRAITIIQSIARQINGELSAKRQQHGHSGKLDFRRTIRKGLETGGSFYRLHYK